MTDPSTRAIAIVGVGAILPDAPDAATFWSNVTGSRYSIREVSPERWDPALFFDADPKAPDKTYSTIGGWVREWEWNPLAWHLPIPPKVGEAMDDAQKWAVSCTRAALIDYGWPERPLNTERTAVILGNAMSGELHYRTALRVAFPELARELEHSPSFQQLPLEARIAVLNDFHHRFDALLPEITEDTMPGELGNCMAGRVANLFDLHGPNFVVDAACASALAAIDASMEGLLEEEYDVVVAGGIDRNMGASSFVKFSKIGALSATGTRPFDAGANGFVMGEGGAVFILKRLADAEAAGDRVYAVIRGVGGASDGRGKGITAPNPVGQRYAVERAWRSAGLSPAACGLVEAHGTSTRVGDVVEVGAINEVFAHADLAPGSVALGSVKSNIGHLKAAAGAAGLLKATLALHHKVLPPSLGLREPNPNVDWSTSPFRVNTELREWTPRAGQVRTAAVSAFGFGGTNFHMVLEEHVPGRIRAEEPRQFAVGAGLAATSVSPDHSAPAVTATKAPLRGALLLGANDEAALVAQLRRVEAAARNGQAPAPAPPAATALAAPERLAIDYGNAAELADKAARALQAFEQANPAAWKLLQGRGVFRGQGAPGKVAFLFTGQGSQYANMLADLRRNERIVSDVFTDADRIMTPLLGRPLSDVIFVDPNDADAVARAEADLRQTEITQPAVLTVDLALSRLLASFGIEPDMVMGHSLGEYGALQAADCLTFAAALEAVSARGQEMASLEIEDHGLMVAVFGSLEEVEAIVAATPGNVVVANVNSTTQSVIGGATDAVIAAEAVCVERGFTTARLPVSHAFHTSIVAPASDPLRRSLQRLDLRAPTKPIISNVTGEFYPMGDVVEEMLDLLARQVASPVQFVTGLRNLYAAGARIFVEVGPKWALKGFAAEVLGDDAITLSTNHPKAGDIVSFNQAICGLYAAGVGASLPEAAPIAEAVTPPAIATAVGASASSAPTAASNASGPSGSASGPISEGAYLELGRMFADFLDHGREVLGRRGTDDGPRRESAPVVISGAALGTPGTAKVFDDANLARLLHGEQFIDVIPAHFRQQILDLHITRLVKSEEGGRFETINSQADVVKLAARPGTFDLGAEFGVDADRLAALGGTTRLAMAAGIDALRDAGIPLVMRYKTTHLGTQLPERWGLPDELRDSTGVIFGSAFPGLDEFASEMDAFAEDRTRRARLADLQAVRERVSDPTGLAELDRRIDDLRQEITSAPYEFDRRFLFRVLSMGHSQFADLIGARGPNTQVNAACASTTQAIALAEDWIREGRCERVVIVAADDVTSDQLLGWMGAGFLATGAAATDDDVTQAALPFDRRRHGMILGMGAAALVVESAASTRERGLQPICEVLSSVSANSAFHGTRLDVDHIGQVMEQLVQHAELRTGINRHQIAAATVFVSHETYTPARGGSASAEIFALRKVFGASADQLVIANTKGFTGHPMGVGLEDVVAVKVLETGIVPPVANLKEPDPDLGNLNVSKGGSYPVQFALRLAAGFGSQIAMVLLRWTPVADGRHRRPDELGFAYRVLDQARFTQWLQRISGDPAPELEVVQHRLRLVDHGPRRVAPVVAKPTSAPAMPRPPVTVIGETRQVPVPAPFAAPLSTAVFATTPAAATTTPAVDAVVAKIVALVAEQTGYPPDMLALDLDLEADLGIDTVKQAELFATVRAAYNIERDEKLKLRDYPTLQHVIGFVRDRAPQLATTAPATATTTPATATAPPATAPAATTAPATNLDAVVAKIVALVAEQTGYPPDMLDLDLDLEADLGIDTVKQAELFATVRAAYNIERDEKLKLRDYPTLQHVIGFVRDRAPQFANITTAEETPPGATDTAAVPSADLATGFPRRVPVAVLRPALDICAATGVSLGGGTRVVVMADRGGVAQALVDQLRDRGVEVLEIDGAPEAEALEAGLTAWRAAGAISGVYWLPALDDEGPFAELEPSAWKEATRVRVKLLAATMRALYDDIAPSHTFLVSATRLGGYHGYDAGGALSPMGGAVRGFTKAYARERSDALVKVVDVGSAAAPVDVASALVEETLADRGMVEVGRTDGQRWSVGLGEQAVTPDAARALGADSVIVVTGAAGSIVSAITADLAGASGATFHLLDLTPEPDPADTDVERFVSDRDGLKRDLAQRISNRGDRATPALVDRELARIERLRAAHDAIEAVRSAGGTPLWYQVDLTDAEAVMAVMATVRERSPRVDVLLHCAGLEISRFLADKPQREFDLVFDVKADGWFHLLRGLGDTPVGSAVVFSSIAGRFGNGGQTDYSSANDLLCASVSNFRTSRPGTVGIAIDWTAWASIGMASRGSIPKMMALAGIDMLPPEIGIPAVRHEITAAGPGREVVVAGRLGLLLDERDELGGLDPAAATGDLGGLGPMIGTVAAWTLGDGLVVHTTLDPTGQGFLYDHRIDGTPVLPGVMGIEAFAETAALAAPGWSVSAVEDVEFLAPCKFYRDEPRTLEITAQLHPDGDDLVAECRLIGRRSLAGQEEQVTTHFTGRVRLSAEPLAPGGTAVVAAPTGPVVTPEETYRVYFHGPTYQVLDGTWRVGDGAAGRFAAGLPANHDPSDRPTLMDPRLIELCFQTAGMYQIGTTGTMALPHRVARVVVRPGPTASGWRALVTPGGEHGGADALVVDDDGGIRVELTGYETIMVPTPVDDETLAPLRRAMT